MKESIKKYKVYAHFVPVSGGTIENATSDSGETISYKIKHSSGVISSIPESDFHINIPLYKEKKVHNYVNIDKQDNIETLQRQRVNPFFIEFSFFDSIIRNKINTGSDLSKKHIQFIRENRPDVDEDFPSNQTFQHKGETIDGDDRIRVWFDLRGKSQLPWNEGTENEVTINDLDKVVPNVENIVSKADLFNININR